MINFKLKTQKQRPIGLDIGNSSIKMIQLAVDNGRVSVVAADKVQIDPDINGDAEKKRTFVISAIKQMLAKSNFCGRDVVSCLPNEASKITSLRVAEMETRETERFLKKEVAQRFGFDPEKDAINYILAGNVRQGNEVKRELILFAADHQVITSHIRMLEQAQLIPVAIDTVPCALFRGFERFLDKVEEEENTVVFVDIGNSFTTIVFVRGEEISFVKQIPIGGEKFNSLLASKLSINVSEAEALRDALRIEKVANVAGDFSKRQASQSSSPQREDRVSLDPSTRQVIVDSVGAVAEKLAREISLCFRYYTVTFRGKRVERAILSGGEAYEGILLNVLKRRLTVEIELARPLRDFDMTGVHFDSDDRGLLCEWAVAVGLSLKGWNGIVKEMHKHERN